MVRNKGLGPALFLVKQKKFCPNLNSKQKVVTDAKRTRKSEDNNVISMYAYVPPHKLHYGHHTLRRETAPEKQASKGVPVSLLIGSTPAPMSVQWNWLLSPYFHPHACLPFAIALLQPRGSQWPAIACKLWALPEATITTLTAKPTKKSAFIKNPMLFSEEEYTLWHHLSLACNHPLNIL